VGETSLEVIHTPGHSPGSICLYADGQLFTGDTLFVNWCGRTDFFGGDESAMKNSLIRLMELPEETVVWPGHDYGREPQSTLGREKRKNRDVRRLKIFADG
jgi:glyoxylase-like metal-dependent hydrolase (beta-lactamase superfamily II)